MNENQALISIFVPIYNVENYLRKCIGSLVSQTYKKIEIILVDDGSTDNSDKICDEYAQKDGRIIVIHQKNAGISQVRVNGCRQASGAYITFVDGDDFVASNYIEELAKVADKSDFDYVSCQIFMYENGDISEDRRPIVGLLEKDKIHNIIRNQLLYDKSIKMAGIHVYTCAKLYKREVLIQHIHQGLGVSFVEDIVTNFSLLKEAKRIYILDKCLYYYVQRAGQATREDIFKMWDKFVTCWKALIALDEEHLLEEQLYLRIWHRLRPILRQSFEENESFKVFKKRMKDIGKYKDIHSIIVSKQPNGKFENLMYYALKYRAYWPCYMMARLSYFAHSVS